MNIKNTSKATTSSFTYSLVHHIIALYTPMARNPPAKAAMTYLCAVGRGAPFKSSYAIPPLDPGKKRGEMVSRMLLRKKGNTRVLGRAT